MFLHVSTLPIPRVRYIDPEHERSTCCLIVRAIPIFSRVDGNAITFRTWVTRAWNWITTEQPAREHSREMRSYSQFHTNLRHLGGVKESGETRTRGAKWTCLRLCQKFEKIDFSASFVMVHFVRNPWFFSPTCGRIVYLSGAPQINLYLFQINIYFY